jgi:hypothetical protein
MSGVEIGRGRIVGAFRKASGSQNIDECVEVAPLDNGGRAVRDSKDRAGAVLYFTAGEWTAFLAGARQGEFD